MNLFTRLPLTLNAPTMPLIPEADVDYFVPYEPLAYEHWIFNKGDSSGLIGLKAGSLLTAQSDAPTYDVKHLTLSSYYGKALLTGLEETATIEDTIAVVFRPGVLSSSLKLPFGTLGSAAGGSPFIGSNGQMYATYRGINNSLSYGAPLSADSWYFAAVSRNFSGASKAFKLLIGGTQVVETYTSNSYIPAPVGRKIALGNGYYSSSVSNNTYDFAEFIVFPKAMSATELQALYERRKAKMVTSGINVV